MSIPFNDHLLWNNYSSTPDWYKDLPAPLLSSDSESQVSRAVNELFAQTFKQPVVRSVQLIRDSARLVLKVPIRSIWTPIVLPKNWKQRKRAKINAKLTGYSFVQLVSVPAKFLVALTALATSAISKKKAKCMLNKSERWTAHLDGRASQLEALKKVARGNESNRSEYNEYKKWLYSIDPKLCRKEG